VLRALAAGLLAAIVLIAAVAAATDAGLTYAIASGAFFLAGAWLVAGRIGPHHPFADVGPANHITLVRLCLLAAIAGLLGEPATATVAWLAIGGAIASAVLDGVDGALARRRHVASAFGARFDMETDAMLILVLSLLVWRHGKAGAWVLASGLMRYAFVAAGWLLPWMAAPLRSTRRGKTVAVLQFIGLSAALAPVFPASVSGVIAAVTLALLIWSFAIDVAFLWRLGR
jgi:phosphatidylglycerophosphate synthase